jgi:excisionase family DNA binding protein
MEATNKEYISIREAAKMLSVSLITLHQWSKKGRLKNYQFGKSVFYRRSDLEALKNNAIIHHLLL